MQPEYWYYYNHRARHTPNKQIQYAIWQFFTSARADTSYGWTVDKRVAMRYLLRCCVHPGLGFPIPRVPVLFPASAQPTDHYRPRCLCGGALSLRPGASQDGCSCWARLPCDRCVQSQSVCSSPAGHATEQSAAPSRSTLPLLLLLLLPQRTRDTGSTLQHGQSAHSQTGILKPLFPCSSVNPFLIFGDDILR